MNIVSRVRFRLRFQMEIFRFCDTHVEAHSCCTRRRNGVLRRVRSAFYCYGNKIMHMREPVSSFCDQYMRARAKWHKSQFFMTNLGKSCRKIVFFAQNNKELVLPQLASGNRPRVLFDTTCRRVVGHKYSSICVSDLIPEFLRPARGGIIHARESDLTPFLCSAPVRPNFFSTFQSEPTAVSNCALPATQPRNNLAQVQDILVALKFLIVLFPRRQRPAYRAHQ
ncbi:unnamed protein product [Chondrus crispus]|uniref:Uncharacterized protein n=1 Tax=Chondrus crispus TaxID=2769 RepID=R7QE98_CHOCR|nr:unnamed protein product [Chondrus crispus]CDF36837.1 unnamed protein product [Chondrus crispus]|eukprot:XP_005716656.1 unnamed protein product [Chondrus crispus]